ncbi:glycosyltransferase family 4 protein [Paenibacillaceae bacterium WGS1546]|uniref:glycosyltransferase family 4 protein n=1 Tax=Cohnella sp. WGS1546 TaxID=3366810 RepID=UPI00372CF596
MKILIFNTFYSPNAIGGAEKSVQLIAEGLLECGIQPVVVTTSDRDGVSIVNGIKVHYVRYRNVYWSLQSAVKKSYKKVMWHSVDIFNPLMLQKVKQIVDVEKPDVIHTNNISGFSVAPWLVAKKLNIPVVHTLRDHNLLCVKSTMFREGANCKKQCMSCSSITRLKKYLSNRNYIHTVVGISNYMIHRHQQFDYFKGVPLKRIVNGVIPKNEMIQDVVHPSDSSDLIFLYLGRIEESKGVNYLLEVFNGFPGARLMLGGEIYDKEIAHKKDNGYYSDNITFLGYVNSDVVVKQADVMIVPSLLNEAFGRTIIEAYAWGKPVIGSNRGGIPEFIEHGRTGFIFNPDEQGGLEEIIRSLIIDPSILLAMKERISEYLLQFYIHETIRQYEQVYKEVLN